jgi:HK97 gp10 family phage protein
MANTVRVQVKGLRELGLALKELDKDIQTKVAFSAVAAGASVIKKQAISNAPVSSPELTPEVPPGYVRDNIIMRRQRRPDRGLTHQYAVTVRHKGRLKGGNRTDKTNPYQIGIFNEFGTVKMGAQPFMRPAFDTRRQDALQAIQKRLRARIDKANRKV